MVQKETFYTGFNRKLIERSRELRKNMTKQERVLWYRYLRQYPVKFYRQRSIDGFIADFYCHRARLVVEVDGGQHRTQEGLAYDRERSAVLCRYGLRVLRFANSDIDGSFAQVCKAIDDAVKSGVE